LLFLVRKYVNHLATLVLCNNTPILCTKIMNARGRKMETLKLWRNVISPITKLEVGRVRA
jgi:hypothetical protein